MQYQPDRKLGYSQIAEHLSEGEARQNLGGLDFEHDRFVDD